MHRMGNAVVLPRMSAAEFLAWESGQMVKHEFVDGEVFAMAGAEDNHVTVSLNLAVALHQHLRDTPCRAYMADMKLRVAENFYYPDVFVTCGAADGASPMAKTEAKFIAEVLSDGTAAYDRGAKFTSYRRLPTLEEVLFVDVARRHCDVYRKNTEGQWVLHAYGSGVAIQLASVGLELPAEQLFAKVAGPR